MRFREARPFVLLLLLAACGSKSPSAPTSQRPASLSVTLGVSSMATGQTTAATATAKSADGIPSVATPTWTSDRTSVATVSPSGDVSAVGSGTANIIATYQGLTASAPLTVTPNFAGTWIGTAQVGSCGGFSDPRTCANFVPEGTTATVGIVMVQDGSGVRGSLDLRTFPPTGSLASPRQYVGDLAGAFDAAGVLTLSGPTRIVLAGGAVVDSGVVTEWSTRIASGAQGGSFSHVFPPTESWQTTGTVKWTGMTLKK